MSNFDVVVVGLGAVGAAATHHLAQAGSAVLGLDQYSPPHAMGSSHGDTRITRLAVGEGEAYVPFVARSHELWRDLEEAAGEPLLHETGLLIMAPHGVPTSMHGSSDFMGATTSLADRNEIHHELVQPEEIKKRFPQFRLDGDYSGYFEPGAGYVLAEAAVRAQLDVAGRAGATIHRGEAVVGIDSTSEGVVVTTQRATYSASVAVIASGPWLPELLPANLANLFSVYRQTLVWYDVDDLALTDVPTFIWQFGTGEHDVFYGFPALNGPGGGLKIGTEDFSRPTSADATARDVTDAEIAATYDRCVRGRIPGLRRNAVRSSACLYTVTPDFGFVIDWIPERENVLVASPCSGHGFKHSAAVGEAVAQVAMGEETLLDLGPFSFGRFGVGAA